MNRSMFLLCAGLVTVSCATNVKVDPAGYACDPGNVCPSGYACVGGLCQLGTTTLCSVTSCVQLAQCVGTKVKTFAGSCDTGSGVCSYVPTETACVNGCANGACVDACKGVTCATPPAPVCMGSTLHGFQGNGTCSLTTGVCAYTPVDTVCTNGCTAGACVNQDTCSGVMCTTPPAPVCEGQVLRTYLSAGTCAAGTCSYPSATMTCDTACSAGACVSAAAVFKQTGPRLRFAVSALDVAPGSSGGLAVAVGKAGNVARWNGTEWAVLATPTKENLNAVHFVSNNAAWLVGERRTVWTYRSGVISAVSNPPGSGSSNFVGVYGRGDADVLIVDDVGNWHKWNGSSWASGALPSAKGPYLISSVFIDETNRERIGGKCGSSAHATCIAYRDPTSGLDFGIDLDATSDSSGCDALGPWVDPPPSLGGPDVLCGKPTNELRRHNPYGFTGSVLGPTPMLSTGNGVVGIAGGASHASYVLTSSSGLSATGVLYRLVRSGVTVPVDQLLTTSFGEEHLSLNDAAGVLVADVVRTQDVNNVLHRSPSVNEAFDLGEDWAATTATNADDLVLINTSGDPAVRKAGAPVFNFIRGPAEVSALAAAAQNGTGVLIVGSNSVTGAALIERFSPGVGFSAVATNTPNAALSSVCRISDAEAYAVGTGGLIFSINTTTLSATKMPSTTSQDLLWVDCGAAGRAVACGKNGTVLRLSGGAWSSTTPFPSAARLTGCKLLGDTVWASGDNAFARLDPNGTTWSVLPARAGLRGLFIRAPNDIYGFTIGLGTSDVQRFDGTSWRSAIQVKGMLRGAVQTSAKLTFGGSAGVLVEGQ